MRLQKAEMMDGRQIQKMIEALNKALIQTNKLYTIIRFLNLDIKKIYHGDTAYDNTEKLELAVLLLEFPEKNNIPACVEKENEDGTKYDYQNGWIYGEMRRCTPIFYPCK